MISENEHLRQRMLFSRLDDEWYLVTSEMFGSKEDYVFVIVSMILEVKILITGGGCTTHDGLYGEAPPERGIFFRLHEYGRLGISLVKGHKKVGKSVIWVCERLQKV